MNKKLREFEKQSGLEIYGLGAKRDKWERALEKYAELVVKECVDIAFKEGDNVAYLALHFGVEE